MGIVAIFRIVMIVEQMLLISVMIVLLDIMEMAQEIVYCVELAIVMIVRLILLLSVIYVLLDFMGMALMNAVL